MFVPSYTLYKCAFTVLFLSLFFLWKSDNYLFVFSKEKDVTPVRTLTDFLESIKCNGNLCRSKSSRAHLQLSVKCGPVLVINHPWTHDKLAFC